MTAKNQTATSRDQEPKPADSLLGNSSTHPDRYIYQKNIATSDLNSVVGDRYVVTIERRFASHWTCREVDAPSDRVPYIFTVIPHKDLVPWEVAERNVVSAPEPRIDINSCSAQELLKALPGVGVAAHYIVDRRPKTGYSSLAYLKQLNADLPIDWVGVNSRISFTSIA